MDLGKSDHCTDLENYDRHTDLVSSGRCKDSGNGVGFESDPDLWLGALQVVLDRTQAMYDEAALEDRGDSHNRCVERTSDALALEILLGSRIE